MFHLLVVASGIVVLPVINRALGGESTLPEAPVMSINLDDLFADVASSSRTDEEVDTPLLAEHNSRAADMVDGDTGNPIPAGGDASLSNSIDGTMDEEETATETQSEDLTQPEVGGPPPPADQANSEEGPKFSEMSVLERVRPLELAEVRTPSASSM